MLIVFGLAYVARPDIYRRGIWLKTSVAIRLLSEPNYRRYMRGLGVVMILGGIGLIVSPPRGLDSLWNGGGRLAVGGAETWNVGDREYGLSATHYERAAGNGVVYVMTYPVPSATSGTILSGDEAAREALPLIRYAYEHHAADRARIPPRRGTVSSVSSLAVDLVSPEDRHVIYRYEVPTGEVTWRLAHPYDK